ncbi:MAG TPA: hypothetical protein DHW34_04015 [Actinobacteria bacterium]|nr:hypothetical protein [Actinomycetota bacterium]
MSNSHASCGSIREWLDAYVDGEIAHCGGLSEQEFVDHVTQCTGCLTEVVAARRVKSALARAHAPEEVPGDVYDRVSLRVREAGRETWIQWQSDQIEMWARD